MIGAVHAFDYRFSRTAWFDVLRRAEDDVRPQLPIEGQASELLLLVPDRPGGDWRPETDFPLSPP